MTPERLVQIEELFHAASESAPGEREALLAAADPEVRREVEALLAQSGGGILDRPLPSPGGPDETTVTQIGVGAKLGPYTVEGVLGRGGMGEVYRATDTRLGRAVAIKVTHEKFTDRFEREARAIAVLNHPHICTLYDVGPNYLVMELVEGETLAARLKKGKLSIDEALRYGAQIADALAAAHAKGITHRDLKPGNIILTKSGVKMLDFGLAKSPHDATLTASNAAIGTPAYMAPEQLEGKECDARTDIYSLGLVLFEMANGKRLTQGEPISHQEIPQFGHVMERCVAKDPADRWQAASDVRKELEWCAVGQAVSPAKSSRPALAGWIAASVVLLIALAAGWLYFRATPSPQVVRSSITLPGTSVNLHSFAISPDGRYLAIAAQVNGRSQLWLRALDSFDAQPMASTDDATYPFWSPDSRFIGFFAEGKLKKIAVGGGPAQTLSDAPFGRGGTWNRDDVIVFSPSSGIFRPLQRVPAAGGVPVDVTTAEEGGVKHPVFLPDGRHFLFLFVTTSPERQTGIYLGSLDRKESRRLLQDQSGVAFASGSILFVRDNTLVAQPFDITGLRTVGGVIPIAAGVSKTSNVEYAPVTASDAGTLVYQVGGSLAQNQFAWVDRGGRFLDTVSAPGGVLEPRLSPDEKWLAFSRSTAVGADVWLQDLSRGAEQRFIATPNFINSVPVWSPRGDRVAFLSDRNGGTNNLYQKDISSGQEEPLLVGSPEKTQTLGAPHDKSPSQWSRDGRFIIYSQVDPKTNWDIWVLPMDGAKAGAPFPFLKSEFDEHLGELSPDSRWMAYTSDESGRREVYVRQFPSGQGQRNVSLAGGDQAQWRADGKELFFVAPDGKMMAVPVKGSGASFEPGTPQALFDPKIVRSPGEPERNYDVTGDGQKFLITTSAAGPASATLSVITNWDAGMKK